MWLGGGEILAIVTDDSAASEAPSTDASLTHGGAGGCVDSEDEGKPESAPPRAAGDASAGAGADAAAAAEPAPSVAHSTASAGEVVIDLADVASGKKLGRRLRKAPVGLGDAGGTCRAFTCCCCVAHAWADDCWVPQTRRR